MGEALAPGFAFLLDDQPHDVGTLLRLDAALDLAEARERFELSVSFADARPRASPRGTGAARPRGARQARS